MEGKTSDISSPQTSKMELAYTSGHWDAHNFKLQVVKQDLLSKPVGTQTAIVGTPEDLGMYSNLLHFFFQTTTSLAISPTVFQHPPIVK